MLHSTIGAGEPVRISRILALVADPAGAERLSVREIMDALGERGFAIFVVLLGLPNIIPMVPPIPLVCGLLIGLVSAQMIWGRRTPWLPRRLLDRTISRSEARRVVSRLLPWVQRVERVCRPRLAVFSTPVASRVVGVLLFAFSLGLVFAAPIIGQIPLGVAICLVGLGIVEKDGVVVLAGAVIGSLGISLTLGFAIALVSGVGLMFGLLKFPF